MLQSMLDRQNKHNAKLANKNYAKKFAAKMRVTSHQEGPIFASIEEKEAFLEKREAAKRSSHSTFN